MLENENNEADLNARGIFWKGALNSVVQYAAKYNHCRQDAIKINRDDIIELYL